MTAVLEVDLDRFARNVAHVRATVAPAALMLVVKDDAYGHGLEQIVRRAWEDGVEWFGAFDVRTGLAVRNLLGTVPRIFVWITTRDELDDALSAHLDIGVGDPALLEEVADAAHRNAARARVHLKVDAGLHRNGVRPEAWRGFVERAAALDAAAVIRVVGVWSHLAEASDEEDEASRAVFDRALAAAADAGLAPEVRHLAASAASFARSEFRYDLVRVGAFCYGIRPTGGPSDDSLGIEPVATLRAPVAHVDEGGVHIGIGALDGLPSLLAGRAEVRTPAGLRRVVTVDDYDSVIEPWPGVGHADAVAVFGPSGTAAASATDLAEATGTIGEEIITRLSPGIPRRYRGEGAGPDG